MNHFKPGYLIPVAYILCCIPLCNSCNTTNSDLATIQETIDGIKDSYAPDTRVCYFDIQVDRNNNTTRIHGETNLEAARNEIISQMEEQGLADEIDITLLPDASARDKPYGVINLSVANIRSEPGHRFEMITQANLGTPVRVLKEKDGWTLIQTPDGYLGWVDGAALYSFSKNGFDAWSGSRKVVFTGHTGFVWDPSGQDQPVSDITGGSMLMMTGETGSDFMVEFPDQRKGLLHKSEAQEFDMWMENHNFSSSSIIETAMKFMGHPYLWGGTSTKGVDCSGFTKTVYFLNGIILPRDANQQASYGETISIENNFEFLEPGDLLFFGSPPPDGGEAPITHVGIYTGDLQFIHASGRVWLDSFDPGAENYNEALRNKLIVVKRILNFVDSKGITRITGNELYQIQP